MNAYGLSLALLLVWCAGCTARRPVLYPNEQVERVGWQVAERDIEACMRRAEGFESSGGREHEVARSTVVGAGTGAAVGAVGGAVTGEPGRGAAVGAATGGTAGLLHGLFGIFGSREPDRVYGNFVERCLRDRGYDVIGWE